ncbi:PAS domain S-box protein [Nibribacter ruber]|uniref:histidine kinase n=1 Tax=Nibribacter ruber TaxID=2698458 RepID=A0A6P1NVT6_9BACT|nr:PAS domain-containing sensor histidine kinase [Nibribacter ruber]QHL87170.1 PAS domain S-box protein [Nibribacter ruber]
MQHPPSSSQLAQLSKLTRDLFCSIDQDGQIIFVNEACFPMLGYKQAEMLGKTYCSFLAPQQAADTIEIVQGLLSGKDMASSSSPFLKNHLLHQSGRPVPVEWTLVWSAQDSALYCVGRDISLQQEVKEQLRRQNQMHQVLAQQGADLLALLDQNAIFTYSGGSTDKILGYAPEDLVGKSVFDILHHQDVPIAQEALQQLSQNKQVHISDIRIKTSTGEYKWLEATATNYLDHPYLNSLVLTSRDVTERVMSKQRLQEREQHFRSLFDNSPDMIVFESKDGKILDANPAFLQYFNLTKEEILHCTFSQFLPVEAAAQCQGFLQQAAGGQNVSFTLEADIPPFGLKVFEVSKLPVVQPTGITGVYSVLKDVTDRDLARQELEKLSLVASKTTNGVVIMNAEGLTEWVNGGFTYLTGYTAEDILGQRPGNLLLGKDTDAVTVFHMREKMTQPVPFSVEILNYKKTGESIWFNIDFTPVLNDKGEIIKHIAIQTDITYRKEVEKEQMLLTRELYEQNRDLQQFTYIVSHNLRAPVANALGLAALLLNLEKDTAIFNESLAKLKTSVIQIDSVLKDLNLILSIRDHKNTSEQQKVNLARQCQQMATALREPLESSQATLITQVPEDLCVNGNEAYLFSIFYNLLSNAIKYRSPDRALQIEVKAEQKEGGQTTVSFTDNGLGFDVKRVEPHLFKLYKRFHKNAEGKGIGLFLVKTHVESMGGQIEVFSEVNKGTTFLIHLK